MDNRELGRKVGQSARRAQDVASLVFVHMAQTGDFDDVTITEHSDLFIEWTANWRGKRDDIVLYNGKLYKSIHDVTDAGQNTQPDKNKTMWAMIGDPGDEWPPWSQPIGAHDAYPVGAKVTYNGKHYINTYAGNSYPPGVYGWTEAA